MHVLSQIFTPYTLPLNERYLRHGKTLVFSGSPLRLKKKIAWGDGVNLSVDTRRTLCLWAKEDKRTVVSALEGGNLGTGVQRKRKVVEHISLVRAKEDLSEEQEKDMLDYLYTIQYQMRGIVAISLGRISDQNPEQYTHAIFMRFQTKEDLAKFYENPFYMNVLKEHVMPYSHGFITLDYESEVEDDILPIFRKGEEFNYGVELMLLIALSRSSLGGPAEDAMTSLEKLTMEFPSLIVQATTGTNMNASNMEYTHAVVVRFRSGGIQDLHEQFRIQFDVGISISAHRSEGSVRTFFCGSYRQRAYVTRNTNLIHAFSGLMRKRGYLQVL